MNNENFHRAKLFYEAAEFFCEAAEFFCEAAEFAVHSSRNLWGLSASNISNFSNAWRMLRVYSTQHLIQTEFSLNIGLNNEAGRSNKHVCLLTCGN